MIEIVCDQYGLYDAEDSDSLITEPFQFEGELVKIKSHSETGESLRVIVRNPALFDWFDAAAKYGAQKRIIDPVAELASRLQQSIVPKYLKANPSWIVELGLLDKSEKQPGQRESVENWLKRVLLGEVWREKAPDSPEDLSEFFAYLLKCKENSLHSLEKELLREQLQYWSLSSPDNPELFSWLKKDPFMRARCIVWEQFLSLFPEDKVSAWLQQDQIWHELSQFPNRHLLPRLSLAVQLPENIAAFARLFLLEKWGSSPDMALSFISGFLDFEKSFLMDQLRKQLQKEVSISQSFYEKIVKFEKFPEVLSMAHQLVPAKKPSTLAVDCSISTVKDWVANEYLPFYDSCSLLGQVDSTESCVKEFEMWLQQHYTGMLFGEGMAYSQIAQLKERVLAGDHILMIVFDGLDYLCAHDELLPVMQENGVFPLSDPTPFFAFLPTQTYISKPALVSGKMKSQIPDEVPNASFYEALLQGYLGIQEDDIRSRTDKDGTLLELIQEPAKVYLYLDNYLDRELLHTTIRQYLRKKKYAEYVRIQAVEIVRCLKDFKTMYGESLSVVICSDHGYTVIPKNALVVDGSVGKTGKSRTIFSSEVENVKDLDQEQIWVLHPDLYGLNHEMVILLGYSCFNRRPKGATHGGCSPQEMAVPWFLLSEDKPAFLDPLTFSLEGEIFRKRSDNNLTLNISNPNGYSVTIIEMDVRGLDITSSLPMRIAKNDIGKFHSQFNASGVSESMVEFSVRYRLKSLAGEMENNLILKVPTTGAMSTEFDDDFEI
ncbi:MAG: hypothetical protein U9N63_04620 [Pseudomonadota bacterium]|nr:hypothetical protein [Pseudomonadota bacterium]